MWHFSPLWVHLSTHRGPKRPLWGPWRSSEGPKGPDSVPTVTGWSNWVGNIHIMCPGPKEDLYGTSGVPKRAHFGPVWNRIRDFFRYQIWYFFYIKFFDTESKTFFDTTSITSDPVASETAADNDRVVKDRKRTISCRCFLLVTFLPAA